MNLLNLIATLTLDDSQYREALKKDSSEAKKTSEKTEQANKRTVRSFLKFLAIIVLVTAAIVKLTKNSLNYSKSVVDGAKKMGMSTEAYQKWLTAAKSVGASQDDLNEGMENLNQLLTDASNGSAEAIVALSKLGLSYDDLKDKSPEEQMKAVIEAFAT